MKYIAEEMQDHEDDAMLQPALNCARTSLPPIMIKLEQPFQHQILSNSTEHKMNNDILVTGFVQVNLITPLQSAAAQHSSCIGSGSERYSSIFYAVY